MDRSERFIKFFKAVLPAPFTIAVLLSIFTYFLALFVTKPAEAGVVDYGIKLMTFWESGLWTNSLLVFAVQMMLMLVLGHVLALTKPVDALIRRALVYCNSTANAVAILTFTTLLVALFNWGLGLIFGAIFARKIGEYAKEKSMALNYPLVAAAGYVGLMAWHGGVSGSSLIKVAEPGHLNQLLSNTASPELLATLPDTIGFGQTVFSGMNITASLILLIVVPLVMYMVGKRFESAPIALPTPEVKQEQETNIEGAERLDHSKWLAMFFAVVILGATLVKAFYLNDKGFLSVFTPNNINFFLLGLGLLLHGSFFNFLHAIEKAIGGVSGILIQFPLYFGIMGIMSSSGLVNMFSSFFVSISNDFTFPIFTFFSAGLVNIFVPSGGGQWVVQGPIIVQAAHELGISLPKCIMALAYGDQLTNMLQPFWALPLLGITGLKAKEVLPYTFVLFLTGGAIFLGVLMLF